MGERIVSRTQLISSNSLASNVPPSLALTSGSVTAPAAVAPRPLHAQSNLSAGPLGADGEARLGIPVRWVLGADPEAQEGTGRPHVGGGVGGGGGWCAEERNGEAKGVKIRARSETQRSTARWEALVHQRGRMIEGGGRAG